MELCNYNWNLMSLALFCNNVLHIDEDRSIHTWAIIVTRKRWPFTKVEISLPKKIGNILNRTLQYFYIDDSHYLLPDKKSWKITFKDWRL